MCGRVRVCASVCAPFKKKKAPHTIKPQAKLRCENFHNSVQVYHHKSTPLKGTAHHYTGNFTVSASIK